MIRENSEILRAPGVDVFPEPVSRKFKSRSGWIRIAGGIAVKLGDATVWATWRSDEALSFLRTLLDQGYHLLGKLRVPGVWTAPHKCGVATPLEKDVVNVLCGQLVNEGYEVFVGVKHNQMSGEDVIYGFKPDVDVLAVKGDEIIACGVKGA